MAAIHEVYYGRWPDTIAVPMRKVTPQVLGRAGIGDILQTAGSFMQHGFGDLPPDIHLPALVGTALHNVPSSDSTVTHAAAARLGSSLVDFPLQEKRAMMSEEILEHLASFSAIVDIVLAGYVDNETFGAGRVLTERFSEWTRSPLLCLRDDVYAHQSALAELLGLSARMGGLEKRRIAVSWGFGSAFGLPTTAHSLILAALITGASVRVVAPDKFSLLRRVMREGAKVANSPDSQLEEVHEFEGSFRDVDAVFALNWCRLDDFNHPERNPQYASEFRDWYFTSEKLPNGCTFVTEPPMQTELLASKDLLYGPTSLTTTWFGRRVAALAATIVWMAQRAATGDRVVLV